jgi:multiple sugar transport system ATP-binding protein
MVFQNYALYPHMTVYENMAFGLRIKKVPKDEIDRRVKEAAVKLDIEKFLQRKPKALSGGQRQRVAVGRAIVRNPKVFLFDEPLSNLDAKLRVQMRAELSKLHHDLDATMIYVTHDQVEAMTMATKIVVMKDGKVQQIGAPLELYNHPGNKFVAGFIGSPPMNFLSAKVETGDGGLWLDEGSAKVKVADEHKAKLEAYVGKEVFFGIRPEDMNLVEGEGGGTGSIPVTIEVIEPLGAEINLSVITDTKQPLVIRTPPGHNFTHNEKCYFVPTMGKARYFDKESEVAIV